MNYLAHAFLSNNDPDLLVGNFISDHLRGNVFNEYPPSIIEGIYLHRHIDTFTDQHPKFRGSKRFFYDGFEKHSGILVDIYFDHFLARDFSKYSPVPLRDFCDKVYSVYNANKNILPIRSSRFLDYVLSNDVYSSYSKKDGIEKVLYHLSHRIGHRIQLNNSITLFTKHEKELQGNFEVFFKDAMHMFGISG